MLDEQNTMGEQPVKDTKRRDAIITVILITVCILLSVDVQSLLGSAKGWAYTLANLGLMMIPGYLAMRWLFPHSEEGSLTWLIRYGALVWIWTQLLLRLGLIR
jgi:hypothetical protein